LLLCLGLKCLLLFVGWFICEIRLDKPIRTKDQILGIWNQWDTSHYFDLARNGYGLPDHSTTLVLPPLLSTLIRGASWITGTIPSGGLLVATLLSFLPGLLLYQLARLDLSEDDAFQAMLVLLLFPTSFFIHIVYTEGLFLSVVFAAFLSARRGHWKLAALFGFLAGLTRINAFVLAPALLVEGWIAGPRGRIPRMFAALTVFLGVAIYLAFNYAVTGDALAFMEVQRLSFYRTFATPAAGAANVLKLASGGGADSMMSGVLQAVFIPFMIGAIAVSLWKQRVSYVIWNIGNILIFTAQDFWLSMPRLTLVLFPAFIWLAPKTARPVFGTLWFAGSTLLLSLLAAQFAQGWWVS
ncbi:MAG: hypothetical protein ABIR28_07675, partial [Vicinamibacteria bacterium]